MVQEYKPQSEGAIIWGLSLGLRVLLSGYKIKGFGFKIQGFHTSTIHG
jgi:hypothetical protein